MLSKPENIREKIVQGRLDKMVNEKALLKQPFVKYNLGEGMEKREEDFAAEVEAQTKALAAKAAEEEAKPAVAVSAKQVKELRDKSGAGMMDCKKALQECGGDVEEATNWPR